MASPTSNFWSATTYPNTGNQQNAMNVNFNNGNVNNNNKTNSNYVRCVRALLASSPQFVCG
jgi:hypothetical protein